MVNKLQSHDFMKEEGGSAGTFFSSMLETDRVVGSTYTTFWFSTSKILWQYIFIFIFFIYFY